jgi:class 3 adenylate cyclase
MRSIFRYREERRFPYARDVVWPFVADTARVNELAGLPPYRLEEKLEPDGRVRRIATGKLGPLTLSWEESFGEWEENRYLVERRQFFSGPMRQFSARCELFPEAGGSRLVFSCEIECVGLAGLAAKAIGVFKREGDKRLALIERMIGDAAASGGLPGLSARDLIEPPARRRLDRLVAALADDPAAHGLVPKLVDLLAHAPGVSLRSLRPLAVARLWQAAPDAAVELFLAAQKRGILAMGWDLLCPRCRGAKLRVQHLHELPKGAHCPSCNIDYRRDFTRNVELTFRPEPWVRPLPEGELCSLGPGTTPHVKFQAEVASRSSARFALALPPGPYRFRTVEAGDSADVEIATDGLVPELHATPAGILAFPPGAAGEMVIRNDTDRPRVFVVEDRRWARDALTGERVIAMPAFRRLCPEQLLRPGDDVEIARVTIMFTDLQGSTKLYEILGDARAYRLVRDHFAFLSERVQRHGGFLVKTVGDAVMAAFHDPADAVRAALAIQDGVAAFNAGRADAGIVLKLGLHAGSCIAVTAADVLDYFGSTVNTASRLEHQCAGGEVLISDAVLEDAAAAAAIAGRACRPDAVSLRGIAEPVRFRRVGPPL